MESAPEQDINLAIFDAICKLLRTEDFAASQKTFFFKHKDTFTEDDENKLEYTQIHEAYVQILETLIAANLKEDYSDEQIDAFYQDFTANIPKYEERDALGVNSLFSFTDLPKFKESILMFKKDEAATFQSNEDDKAGIVDINNQDEGFYWELR